MTGIAECEYRAQMKAWAVGTVLGLMAAIGAAGIVTWATAARVAVAEARYQRTEATVLDTPALQVKARPDGVVALTGSYRAPVAYRVGEMEMRASTRVPRDAASGSRIEVWRDLKAGSLWSGSPGTSPLPDYGRARLVVGLLTFLAVTIAYALGAWRLHLDRKARHAHCVA